MARIEINVNDIISELEQKWETKKKGEGKNDKHKDEQEKPVRKPK